MNALLRFRHQIRDLVERYVDEDGDPHRPLMTQLLVLGPHMRPSQDVVGKVQPRSTPPGNLDARQLYDSIRGEAVAWAKTLAGHRIPESKALTLLPALASQCDPDDERLHTRDSFEGSGGHEHRIGLYSTCGRWHSRIRVFLCYDTSPTHYPSATCPECVKRTGCSGPDCCHHIFDVFYGDRAQLWNGRNCTGPNCGRERCWGTMYFRGAGAYAFCSNSDCRDGRGFRREFSWAYLQRLFFEAIADDLRVTTAATGIPA